jgi:hypothetical protein
MPLHEHTEGVLISLAGLFGGRCVGQFHPADP